MQFCSVYKILVMKIILSILSDTTYLYISLNILDIYNNGNCERETQQDCRALLVGLLSTPQHNIYTSLLCVECASIYRDTLISAIQSYWPVTFFVTFTNVSRVKLQVHTQSKIQQKVRVPFL